MTQIQTEKVEGLAEKVKLKPEKNYYGVKVNGSWFNGELTDAVGAEQVKELHDKKVELQVNGLGTFIDIEDIKVVGDPNQEGLNSESKAGEGGTPATDNLSRAEQIKVNTAFQQAVETVRQQEKVEDLDEHFEQVNRMANGYRQVLDKQMQEQGDVIKTFDEGEI